MLMAFLHFSTSLFLRTTRKYKNLKDYLTSLWFRMRTLQRPKFSQLRYNLSHFAIKITLPYMIFYLLAKTLANALYF